MMQRKYAKAQGGQEFTQNLGILSKGILSWILGLNPLLLFFHVKVSLITLNLPQEIIEHLETEHL